MVLWGLFLIKVSLFKLLVVFEHHRELFSECFVPDLVLGGEGLAVFLIQGFRLPFVFLQEPSHQLTHQGVELRAEDALLEVVGRDATVTAQRRLSLV